MTDYYNNQETIFNDFYKNFPDAFDDDLFSDEYERKLMVCFVTIDDFQLERLKEKYQLIYKHVQILQGFVDTLKNRNKDLLVIKQNTLYKDLDGINLEISDNEKKLNDARKCYMKYFPMTCYCGGVLSFARISYCGEKDCW